MLSPADGRVKFVGDAEPGVAPPGEWKQISIFLSPMDVHVNRIPAAGTVTRVSYTPGNFCRRTATKRPPSTSAARSGSIAATAKRSSRARSSAFWRGASSAARASVSMCMRDSVSAS